MWELLLTVGPRTEAGRADRAGEKEPMPPGGTGPVAGKSPSAFLHASTFLPLQVTLRLWSIFTVEEFLPEYSTS